MKLTVAIIVYDRLENIDRWISSFPKCENDINAELVVIHNFKNLQDKETFNTLCETNNIRYVPRENIGMDIGAFQDICRERLEGFPNDWNNLLWVTDDVIPMKKDFLTQYMEKKTDNNVVCLEMSAEAKLHVRTTGFLIDKQTANKLQFPADPVTNKDHCYGFEHRSPDAFLEQIKRMGKEAVQVHPTFQNSCLWDTDCRGHLNRWAEYSSEFN